MLGKWGFEEMQLPSYRSRCSNWKLVPPDMIIDVRLWVENGVVRNSGLIGLLTGKERKENDLYSFFKFHTPDQCWGSTTKFDLWRERGGLQWPAIKL